jgi:hypothetical protein
MTLSTEAIIAIVGIPLTTLGSYGSVWLYNHFQARKDVLASNLKKIADGTASQTMMDSTIQAFAELSEDSRNELLNPLLAQFTAQGDLASRTNLSNFRNDLVQYILEQGEAPAAPPVSDHRQTLGHTQSSAQPQQQTADQQAPLDSQQPSYSRQPDYPPRPYYPQ